MPLLAVTNAGPVAAAEKYLHCKQFACTKKIAASILIALYCTYSIYTFPQLAWDSNCSIGTRSIIKSIMIEVFVSLKSRFLSTSRYARR